MSAAQKSKQCEGPMVTRSEETVAGLAICRIEPKDM